MQGDSGFEGVKDSVNLSADSIERRLRTSKPKTISRIRAPKRAAVAALLRFDQDGPEVLLMQRVERQGDRWSGQVSFPGGRLEPDDPDLLSCAIRETQEEVGIDLTTTARHVGQLSDVQAIAMGKALPMAIRPFVFFQTEVAEITISADEAEHTFWLPLQEVIEGAFDGEYEYRFAGIPIMMNCWRFQGNIIWGLTHRMLSSFFELIHSE